MENIKVNIESFDEANHSLIVSFSGVEGGVEYRTLPYAFQTYSFNTQDTTKIINQLAILGNTYLEQEKHKQESVRGNLSFVDELKNMIGTSIDINVPSVTPRQIHVSELVDNLEVIV